MSAHAASDAFDPAHTSVTFEIGHFGISTNGGRFDKKEGTPDRTQFRMSYGIDWGFPKNIRLVVQAEAVKQ